MISTLSATLFRGFNSGSHMLKYGSSPDQKSVTPKRMAVTPKKVNLTRLQFFSRLPGVLHTCVSAVGPAQRLQERSQFNSLQDLF